MSESFRAAMRAHGLKPPDTITPGKLHRFSTNGKRGDDAGWCKKFADEQAGVFGDWRTGLKEVWFASGEPTQASRAETQAAIRAMQAEREGYLVKIGAETARMAQELWAAAFDVGAHPYLVRKGVTLNPCGAREISQADACEILGYTPWARGETLQGQLLVLPVQRDGAVVSAELIDQAGRKSALRGEGTRSGSFWAAQPMPEHAEHLIIAEGVATTASCCIATGWPGVAALSVGNLKRVAEAMRNQFPEADLVLAADVDKSAGEPMPQAVEAAQAVGARLAWPVFAGSRLESQTDFNDLHVAEGLEAVETAMVQREARKIVERLPRVEVADLFTHPSKQTVWLWRGWLPADQVTLFGAHGGTGKSFFALQLAVSVALGRSLFGIETLRCKVLFVSLEDGVHVVRGRLAAICVALGVNPAELAQSLEIREGTADPELFAAEGRNAGGATPTAHELDRVVKALQPGLIIIDNASDAFGADEIQRRQVRAFIRQLAALARSAEAALLLLAHVDKNVARGEGTNEAYSGSTAWNNSARSRWFLKRERAELVLSHQKSNLGPLQKPLNLIWPEGGIPELAGEAPNYDGILDQVENERLQEQAPVLLRLMHEYIGRGKWFAPGITSGYHPFKVLEADKQAMKELGLHPRDKGKVKLAMRQLIAHCEREGWLAEESVRTENRKTVQRLTITEAGKIFAGVLVAPTAPTAPTAPVTGELAHLEQAGDGAPTAPSPCAGGLGGVCARAEVGAEVGAPAESVCETEDETGVTESFQVVAHSTGGNGCVSAVPQTKGA